MTYVTFSAKTIPFGTFGISRNTILKYWSHCRSLVLCFSRARFTVYVTRFRKTCIVDTSNFSTLVTHNISLEGQIDVKLLGNVEPIFLYHPWKFQIFTPLHVVFMDLWMSKIRCVNFARFPKSGHIYKYSSCLASVL